LEGAIWKETWSVIFSPFAKKSVGKSTLKKFKEMILNCNNFKIESIKGQTYITID